MPQVPSPRVSEQLGRESLTGVDAFRDLAPDEIQQLENELAFIQLQRGQYLFRQGETANALYVVVSGRFAVVRDGQVEPVAGIGAGHPIGEIAFFAGGARTANVIAERDSVVVRLGRAEFDALARRLPQLWRTVTATLARRLAATTASRERPPVKSRPRTVCIVPAGAGDVSPVFLDALKVVFQGHENALFLDSAGAEELTAGAANTTQWFNELELRYDAIVYIADETLSAWSQKAIRQADLVLCVGEHREGAAGDVRQVSKLEQFAAELHKADRVWLVLLHERTGPIHGSRSWLDRRPWCQMHHHVFMDDDAGCERLFRFVTGQALGLVASGGGAFSSAHIGVYQALVEAGYQFDMLCGTSGGAAMAAAFALGEGLDEIERRTHDIFVTRKAFKRWTLPRYSLLDPAVFDDALLEHFTDIDIADLPVPYFAISTNLSQNSVYCHQRGPLWQAIRASSAIPALLPPVFSGEGDVLVDGCLLENVPVRSIHRLKSGPNIVIGFQVPGIDRIEAGVGALPSRSQLILNSFTAHRRNRLPKGPSPQAILLRSLMLQSRSVRDDLEPGDILLEPVMPDNVSHLDWHKHALLRQHAYAFACRELARLK